MLPDPISPHNCQFFAQLWQTLNTIIVGDFNLDLNKSTANTTTYASANYLKELTQFREELNLEQIVTDDTWHRSILGVEKSSRIDHIYHTQDIKISKPVHSNAIYSDHQIISSYITYRAEEKEKVQPVWMRNWYKYSNEKLVARLKEEAWNNEYEHAQDLYDWICQKLVTVIDELAPLTKRKNITCSSYHETDNKTMINKHRRLVARWKKGK